VKFIILIQLKKSRVVIVVWIEGTMNPIMVRIKNSIMPDSVKDVYEG
jgi:hypothetical protein